MRRRLALHPHPCPAPLTTGPFHHFVDDYSALIYLRNTYPEKCERKVAMKKQSSATPRVRRRSQRLCDASHDEKCRIARQLGPALIKRYGKKKHYTPQEIRDTYMTNKWDLDFSCWGMSLFSSQPDFDAYHKEIGEVCDYGQMKSEMLSAVTDSSPVDWTAADVDSSWLDLSSIDWSAVFDFDISIDL
jgi:hypothetical protein